MKSKVVLLINRIICSIIIFAMANIYLVMKIVPGAALILILVLLAYIIVNVMRSMFGSKYEKKRLNNLSYGIELLIEFLISTGASIAVFVMVLTNMLPEEIKNFIKNGVSGDNTNLKWNLFWIINCVLVIVFEAIVFWNGIIRIYICSEQLGVKWRTLGALCGWIPIVHLFMLGKIIKICMKELQFENDRLIKDKNRAQMKVCETKYPILMVHGVFFRDFRYLNYWGRIPKALEANGARIFYGNHQSAAAVSESAKELADRIMSIVKETGCEKVNVIAHSKGGLDMRAALMIPGISEHVASLTTVNTPHRGCEFADYLLSKIGATQQQLVAKTYNSALKKLGDTNPDFLAAVNNLTFSFCESFNQQVKDVPEVLYQSIGSKLNVAKGGRFPLNFSYYLVDHFDGPNDGLVGENSCKWGDNFTFLTVNGDRGISHGDVIDLNRENIPEFDVREFYIGLVNNLKEKGL